MPDPYANAAEDYADMLNNLPLPETTEVERALMRDCLLTTYAQLIGPPPEILTDLVRRRLVEWRWNGGIPIYYVTDLGRAALKSGANA